MKLSNGKIFRMNKARKKRWLAALRSKEYKQNFGSLGREYHRCVLGVAVNEGMAKAKFGSYVDKRFLPTEAQKAVGQLNDIKHWSLRKIADWIEENL